MDRLKGEPGSGRRKVQQKKPCLFSSSNSTTGLIWTALLLDRLLERPQDSIFDIVRIALADGHDEHVWLPGFLFQVSVGHGGHAPEA
jgi:hypothetical protein